MLLETLQDRQYILWTIFSRNGNLPQRQLWQPAYYFFYEFFKCQILWSIRLANVLQKASIFIGFQVTY